MGIQENLKRGTVEMLILFLLKSEDMYGYQIAQELSKRSNELFALSEGSMYPTLYRLIDKEYISDHKELVGRRRTRVYYHLEEKGAKYLEDIVDEYKSINKGIENIFNYDVEN